MSNPITTSTPTPPPAPSKAGGRPSAAEEDFGALVKGAGAADRPTAEKAAKGAGAASETHKGQTGNDPQKAASDLEKLLGKIKDTLEGLTPENGETADVSPEALAGLQDLLSQLQTMLETLSGASASGGLGPKAMETLSKLLGGAGTETVGELSTLLETVANRAGEGGKTLKEGAPQLADRLADLAKHLDGLSAQLAATRDAKAAKDPDMLKRLAATKDGTDANAALAKAEGGGDDAAKPSDRTLVAGSDKESGARPNAGNAAMMNDAIKAAKTAAAASASAPADASGDKTVADLLASVGSTANGAQQTAAAVRPGVAPYSQPPQQVNMPFIAAEIARHVQNGNSRFEIKLNPPELGRVDVRLDLDKSGHVTARLAVERSETLDLMQRDQRTLERALAQAGLDSSKTNLEFSLKQNGSGGQDGFQSLFEGGDQGRSAGEADGGGSDPLTPVAVQRGFARLDAVNLWV